VLPCEKLTNEVIHHPKFMDCTMGGLDMVEGALKQEKRSKPSAIPYYLTIIPHYPQYVLLVYMPKEKILREYIKVKPKGLFFHEAYHPNINYLIAWFKRHFAERTY
jgi:transcription elongation factor SPT6